MYPRLGTSALEGLNNSLAQSGAELWLAKICPEGANHTFREIFFIFVKNGVFEPCALSIVIFSPYSNGFYLKLQKSRFSFPHFTCRFLLD